MKACFAYLLAGLVLLQTFSRELLVADFMLNQAAITQQYCINKSRPMLHCDGKCYFAKQLKKQEERQSKSAGPLKERLDMLPTAFAAWQPCPTTYPVAATGYGPATGPAVPTMSRRGVFHPPQRLG